MTDYHEQAHNEYLEQVSESGIPLWVLDYYGSLHSLERKARPLYQYRLTWLDEYNGQHYQIADAPDILEAMEYIHNQAMQFGYKQCRFIKVELNDTETQNKDLPF